MTKQVKELIAPVKFLMISLKLLSVVGVWKSKHENEVQNTYVNPGNITIQSRIDYVLCSKIMYKGILGGHLV